MPFNITMDKARKDIERTFADVDKTPLYAVVGVTDLAAEKLRSARTELSARAAQFDPKTLRDQAQTTVSQRMTSMQTELRSAPEQARGLPLRAQSALDEVVATAVTAYGDLAGRGKTLVTRVRRQQATQNLADQAKSTVSRAKSTRTTVKNQAATVKSSATATAETAKESVGETATTVKQSASRAKSSGKATTTSAKKTAAAAKKATSATASKVGS